MKFPNSIGERSGLDSHCCPPILCIVSSVVERLFYTERVGSSKLSRCTKFICPCSNGKMRVSKTLRWEFESLRVCQLYVFSKMNITLRYERRSGSLILSGRTKILDSNAAGVVLRPALKTGFSEMGWGSTPLLSAILTWQSPLRKYVIVLF